MQQLLWILRTYIRVGYEPEALGIRIFHHTYNQTYAAR